MIFEILCAVLSIILIFLGMLVYYSLKRITIYEEIILNFNNTIDLIKHQLKLIDERGTFESDDEVGFFFEEIKQLGENLGELFETEVDDEKTQEEK